MTPMSNDKPALCHVSPANVSLPSNVAIPVLPEGVRVEDRRPVKEMEDRPAMLMLAKCPRCGEAFIFITSEKDTCNYSTVCGKCSRHT
jgi:ribosomal protein S27AE